MAAPKTVKTYPLDGVQKDFEIPFEYLARKFVVVTLIGPDRLPLVLNVDYRFTSRTIITMTRSWVPSEGYTLVEIKRVTSATERLVDFSDGSVLRASDLNTSSVQSLHIAEEGRDIATDTIGVDNNGNLDGRGRRIVNVADGIDPGDAITMGQMDRWADSAKVSADKAKVSETNAKASEVAAKGSEVAAQASENNLTALYTSVIRVHEGNLKDLEGPRSNRILGFDANGDPKALVLDQGTNTALSGFLNSPEGASLIRHGRASLSDLLDDTCNIRQFGAVGDGTKHPASEFFTTLADLKAEFPLAVALTDSIDHLAIEKAFAVSKRRVLIPDGHFIMEGRPIRRNKSIRLEIDGIVDFRATTTGTPQLLIEGELIAIPKISGNLIRAKTRTFGFVGSHTLAHGDVFGIHNPADFSWSPGRKYYNDGEFFEVSQPTSTTSVRIFGTPDGNYTGSLFNVYKMPKLHVHVSGLGEVLSSTTRPVVGLSVKYATQVVFDNVNATSGLYAAASIDRCHRVRVDGGACIDASPVGGNNYGLVISNSTNVTITAGEHRATRHAIALGGAPGPMNIPFRNVHISGCNLANADQDGIGAADMHGCGARITYIDCDIDSSCMVGGRDLQYVSCRIKGRNTDDALIAFGSEMVGGYIKFINCEFETSGNWAAYAPISVVMVEKLKEPLDIVVDGCTVRGNTTLASGSTLVKVSPATGETTPIRVWIDNVRAPDAVDLYGILFLRSDSTPNQQHAEGTTVFIGENVQVPWQTQTRFLREVNVGVLDKVKFNLPRVTVSTEVTVPNQSAIVATPYIPLPYIFPRQPVMTPTWYKPAGESDGMYVGTKVPVVGPYLNEINRCQIGLMPSDNTKFVVASGTTQKVVLAATLTLKEF